MELVYLFLACVYAIVLWAFDGPTGTPLDMLEREDPVPSDGNDGPGIMDERHGVWSGEFAADTAEVADAGTAGAWGRAASPLAARDWAGIRTEAGRVPTWVEVTTRAGDTHALMLGSTIPQPAPNEVLP